MLDNTKHELFAQHVARGKSMTESYVTAGYSENGNNGPNLAQVPAIAERIIELKQIVAARAQVTAERVLAELARIGFADVTQAVEIKRGMAKIKDTKNLPQDVKQAISEIRSGRDGTVVKFHDKVRALDALGKHLGLFKENIELNVNVSLADLVNGSYKLAAGEQPGVIEHQANEPDASHALPNEQGDGGEAS